MGALSLSTAFLSFPSLPAPAPRLLLSVRRPLPPFKALASDNDPPPDTSPPTPLSVEELESKLGVRRRSRSKKPADSPPPKPPPKNWDSMTFAERVWELYIGEKGALFWLNKLAYAAIFAIVGGWVFFRFIGPALGWYQLESPLLPPDRVFGGPK